MYRDELKYYRPENDSRLINVSAELRRLRALICDLEWNGQDASHLYPKCNFLSQAKKEGTNFIPRF